MTPLAHLKAADVALPDDQLEKLAGRVSGALESARLIYPPDDDFSDFLGPDGSADFGKRCRAAESLIYAALKAIQPIGSTPPEGNVADPQLIALVNLCPAPPGVDPWQHADQLLGMLRALSTAAQGMPKRSGGRPSETDVMVEVAVRATMHFLCDIGRQWSGGWKYEDRPGTKPLSRSEDGQLSAHGPARVILAVVAAFALNVDPPAVKTYHDEYCAMLRREERGPNGRDYIELQSQLTD